ncbi:hypothetical protein [Corynebacterium lubricantis]|uniref:hypothetical protein n=1 Tax=Corynebacterium lubricantis TaxID=541095 RepID=UPI0004780D99|nr:hypothetical protein [Corynebacterium lubricantis]
MRKLLLGALAVATSVSLAACGGATVDSEDVTTPVAPPTSSSAESSTETSASSSETTTSQSSTTAKPPAPASDQPEDIGAREVEEVPEQSVQYSPEEQAFLDEVTASDVNVDSVQDQLIGTAQTICGGDTVTRDAVAGQLIEQGRTDLTHAELTKLLDDSAHANLC